MSINKYLLLIAAAAMAFAAGAATDVAWLQRTYDFGAFNETDGTKEATFRFVNITDEPVTITSATATCGCTTPVYSKDAVMPGDTATIHVAYNPAGRPGKFVKYVYIRTSASDTKTKLQIKGAVVGDPESVQGRFPIEMGPLRLRNGAVMIGKVKKSTGRMAYLDIYNMSLDTLRPVIVGAPKYASVTVGPDEIPPGEQGVINVYFRADQCPQWGMVTDTLRVSPNPGDQQYVLPVIAIVEEDFSTLNPDQLADAPHIKPEADRISLGKVPAQGKAVQATMKITNTGKDPLIIRRVYSEDPGVSVKVSKTRIKSGKSAELTVTFDPAAQPEGIVNARVTIIANDPASPTTVIRVVGER